MTYQLNQINKPSYLSLSKDFYIGGTLLINDKNSC